METRNRFETEPEFVNTNPGMGGFIRKPNEGVIGRYRYEMKNLKPLLIHFAKMYSEKRPNTIVQKDGNTAHSHEYQALVYVAESVERLIWPTNSL